MAKSTDRCESNGAGTFGSIQPVDLDDPLEGISLIEPKLPILFCFLFLFCFEVILVINLTNLSADLILTPL